MEERSLTTSEHTDHAGDAPPGLRLGGTPCGEQQESSRGSRGLFQEAAWSPSQRRNSPAPAGAAIIRVSEARLYPPKAEGGESGRRAQYLLDILGTTDRLPPLCPWISMIVSYVYGDHPMYIFKPKDVPADCCLSYAEGEDMFEYLDKNLLPSDIKSVSISVECDGVNCTTRIVFNIRESVVLGMPHFKHIVNADDMPF